MVDYEFECSLYEIINLFKRKENKKIKKYAFKTDVNEK